MAAGDNHYYLRPTKTGASSTRAMPMLSVETSSKRTFEHIRHAPSCDQLHACLLAVPTSYRFAVAASIAEEMMLLSDDEKLLLRSACVLLVGVLAGLTYAMIGKI